MNLAARSAFRFAAIPMVLAGFGASAGQAAATDPPAPTGINAAFGNTIVSTYTDHRQAKLWLKADGTYTGEGRKHDPSDGMWTLKGGELCLRQRNPRAIPYTYCTAFPNGTVGSSWMGRSVFGDKISITLVAGLSGG